MVALKGINKVMAQNNLGMPPMVMSRYVGSAIFLPGCVNVHENTVASQKEVIKTHKSVF